MRANHRERVRTEEGSRAQGENERRVLRVRAGAQRRVRSERSIQTVEASRVARKSKVQRVRECGLRWVLSGAERVHTQRDQRREDPFQVVQAFQVGDSGRSKKSIKETDIQGEAEENLQVNEHMVSY